MSDNMSDMAAVSKEAISAARGAPARLENVLADSLALAARYKEERDEALSALGAALDGGDAATEPAKADVWDGALCNCRRPERSTVVTHLRDEACDRLDALLAEMATRVAERIAQAFDENAADCENVASREAGYSNARIATNREAGVWAHAARIAREMR